MGADASPLGAGASSDGQTVVAQATPGDTETPTQAAAPPAKPSVTISTPETQDVPVTEVTVAAEKDKPAQGTVAAEPFVAPLDTTPYTHDTVTREGMKVMAGPAQASIDKALSLFPSVMVDTVDPYGLNRSRNDLVRVRGQTSDALSYSLDGIPLETGPRFGTRQNSFDLENFSDITLYRGISPADQGFAFGNFVGAVNVDILKPQDKFGVTVSEAHGAFDMNKVFVRVDTGEILPGLKTFLSYSDAVSDKWRGPGDLGRQHISLGSSYEASPFVTARFYLDYTNGDSDNYRPLSYAQARDLGTYYRYDFNRYLTGNAAQDIYYYKFNKIDDNYVLAFSEIEIKPTENQLITLKPYFTHEDVVNYDYVASFNGAPGVQQWRSDRDRYGGIAEYKTSFYGADLRAGYWYEMFKWPYFAEKVFSLNSSDNLVFAGWQKQLLQYDGFFKMESPYVSLTKEIDKFTLNAGLKYFNYVQPRTLAYNNAGVPDVGTDEVGGSATVLPKASVTSQASDAWLPSAGVTYALNDYATPYASYGRGYRVAYFGPGGIINGYYGNQKTFDAEGITADMLARDQKLETADNIDLGVRLKFDSWQITPIIFYSKYENKSVTILDPTTGIVYRQTVGNAQAHGAELEVNGKLFRSLTLFASGTYDNSTFKSNVPSTSGTASINGNQFPDTPQYMGKLGFTYVPDQLPALAISPVGRYLSSRYGDATNEQKIPGYAVADLDMAYKLGDILPRSVKDVTLCLDFVNIFNKKYISFISVADEARQTAAQYYSGAPFTVSFSVTAKF